MTAGFFKRENDIERLLRAARPHVPEELASRLVARATPVRIRARRGSRLILAGAVTALMVVALASVGGIGYAASTITSVVKAITHQKVFMGSRMTLQVNTNASSSDQYSTPAGTSSSQTVGVNSSSVAAISGSNGTSNVVGSTVTVSGGTTTKTQVTATGTANGVVLTATVTSTTGGTTTTVAAPTIMLPTAAANTIFKSEGATQVVVDPTPTETTLGDQKVIGVTLAFKNGSGGDVSVSNLADPIAVSIPKPAGGYPAGYTPAFSTDGTTFVAVPLIPGGGQTLPADMQTGYYLDASGDYVILTRHATLFAVIAHTGLGVSESGRKLAKPGSGRFGDPLLVHPGPAKLRQVGPVAVFPFNGLSGKAVKFSFFVDEQVAAYVSLFHGNTEVPISTTGTMVRGTTLHTPGTQTTLHIPVLRPGTLNLRLRIPGTYLVPGEQYKLRVVTLDFDGNKTVAFIPVTG